MGGASRFAIAFFTRGGAGLASRVAEVLRRGTAGAADHSGPPDERIVTLFDKDAENLRAWVRREFAASDALLFIGAAGIAVRMLDGLMRGKDRDPAVLVLDEKGQFVIPLLSGHLGGANRLAAGLAREIGARAVLTTATDINGVFAVDEWAAAHDCALADTAMIKPVSAALLRGEHIGFHSDFPVTGRLPSDLVPERDRPVGILVSLDADKSAFGLTLHAIPKIGILGAGCRKDVPPGIFERAALDMLGRHGIPVNALRILASIQRKRDEPCMRAFADKYGLEFRVFSPEELRAVPGAFTASGFVRERIGVDNVCERAAMAAGAERLVAPKTSGNGVSLALAVLPWRCEFD